MKNVKHYIIKLAYTALYVFISYSCTDNSVVKIDKEYLHYLENYHKTTQDKESEVNSLKSIIKELTNLIKLTYKGKTIDAQLSINRLRDDKKLFLSLDLNEIINHCSTHIEFIELLDSMPILDLQNFSLRNTQNSYGEISSKLLKEVEISYFLMSIANGSAPHLEAFIETFPNSELIKHVELLLNFELENAQQNLKDKSFSYINESCDNSIHSTSRAYIEPSYLQPNQYTTPSDLYTNPNANKNLVEVKGYYRKDGTYVKPHVRTAPNSTKKDNLRYKP